MKKIEPAAYITYKGHLLHAKEPWKTGSSPDGKSVVFLVGDEQEHILGLAKNWIDCNTEANARRIVVCGKLLRCSHPRPW